MTTATMNPITRDSLMSLEAYAKARPAFRATAMAHKRLRSVHIGEHVTLLFEDEMTVRYQIQEMLRIEKTFEESAIQDELDAYNPLIPDGSNLKATMLLECPDPAVRAERRQMVIVRPAGQFRKWHRVESHGRRHGGPVALRADS